jgi:hypothetical protein
VTVVALLDQLDPMTSKKMARPHGAPPVTPAPSPADTRSSLQFSALLTVDQVAERLAVSPDWVYRHADDLGAIKLGGGLKPRIRFDALGVAAYVDACRTCRRTVSASTPPPTPIASRRTARAPGRETHLLPIRGQITDQQREEP